MKVESVNIICFSPTGTSRTVAEAISRGVGLPGTGVIDITRPAARSGAETVAENAFLIIAVPVYMGRVPALASEWIRRLQARNTPAACVVVYGNRAYENALRELADLTAGCGCIPIAGAAFIGEHSFSTSIRPIAEGRPDAEDTALAESFGRKIREKLESDEPLTPAVVPGVVPYGGVTRLWDVDFISVSDACCQCGLCADVCPVGAVDPENSRQIDPVRCITCCACIKQCPVNARSMKSGPVMDAGTRLNSLFGQRKQPELFF